jgi:RNA polymerase sigma factor (sigma-70 family)
MDDRQLIERCITGDNGAWRLFLEQHGSLLYGTIAALLAKFSISDPDTAADIFEAVIEKLLADGCAALRQFKWNSKFTTYLVAISRNKTYDYIRATKRRPTVSISSPIGARDQGEQEDLEKLLASDLDLDRDLEVRLTLDRVLQDLPGQDQLILKLYYIEGLRDGEIADLLNLTADAVSARKSRALKRLRERVGRERS